MAKWTRRVVIGAGGLIGGGLVLGVGGIALAPSRLRVLPTPDATGDRLTTWIKITPDNAVVAVIPHCEMGQGALTGIAMLMAEELDADWNRVQIEEAPAEDVYANGYFLRGFAAEAGLAVPAWLERAVDFGTYKIASLAGMQVTGGSSSTRATGQLGLRVAGAAARAMLMTAAAARFGAQASELEARDSIVTHAASGSRATYGELASAAAALPVPLHPVLKPRTEHRIVGTSRARSDIPGKVDGSTRFGIDVVLPEMLYAAVVMAPVPGGRLAIVDPTLVDGMPGVRRVVALADAVAVVAEGYWQAQRALDALKPQFTDGGASAIDSVGLFERHVAALDAAPAHTPPAEAARVVTAEYRVPYLAHATMEPMAATARYVDGRCEVWAGTQDPLNARRAVAAALEIDDADVALHNLPLGGGFGRRLPGAFDYVEQAVRIARELTPRPVKLIWSREQDMTHDYYRPAVVARLASACDAAGRPMTWWSRFTTAGLLDRVAATPIYGFANPVLEPVAPPRHLREGSWRSVDYSQHAFFVESFVDELAAEAGRDPLEYRLDLLAARPRHRAVLEHAATMAEWGTAPPANRARGVAIVEAFGTVVAEVAEVAIEAGRVRVARVDAAVDCGLVVNPDQARAQIEGGIVFGLSAALYQRITVKNGAVEQKSFPDYGMVRLSDAPRIRAEFLESTAPLGGLGEPAVPPIAPAVANAVYALTGQRLRELPLRLT